MLFISSEKLFSFSIYSNFCISLFPSFSPYQPLLEKMMKLNLKVFHVTNWPNKNLKAHFAWYLKGESRSDIKTWSIGRVLNKIKGTFFLENGKSSVQCSDSKLTKIRGGSNLLKRTNIEGGQVHVKRTDEHRRKGVKNRKFWANILFKCPTLRVVLKLGHLFLQGR